MKGVSVYGAFEGYEPVWQRYWHVRKDGIRQRYWHKTKRMKKVVRTDARFEFTGTGRDLFKAIVKARGRVPTGYVEVEAREFLENPGEYSVRGQWVDWHVAS
ncbi:MAG: hypothetical protein QGF78_06895 [Candidatus Bathyarchaeota archaeon]|jgi:hypothetical protein|nr:hypothetical protein [Candidatus Bathyarchaeota archaeon]